MANQTLVDFLREILRQGISIEHIRAELRRSGGSDKEVREGVRIAVSSETPKIYCKQCGEGNSITAETCKNCEYNLKKVLKEENNKRIWYIFFGIIVLLSLVFLLSKCMFTDGTEPTVMFDKPLENELFDSPKTLHDLPNTILVSTQKGEELCPVIYGDEIVWKGENGGIYLYNLVTAQEMLLTASQAVRFLSIYEDNLVYAHKEGAGLSPAVIHMYNLSGGKEVQITVKEEMQLGPDIYGNKVVWEDFVNSNYDIYMYDLSTGIKTQITTNLYSQKYPSIYKDKMVWSDNRHGDWDIYVYDINTGAEEQLVTARGPQVYPNIYGDKVIWVDYRKGNYPESDIYMYDLSTGIESRITSKTFLILKRPEIYDDKIVWWSGRNGVYMYDMLTKEETQLIPFGACPSIYEDKLAWSSIEGIYVTTVE